MAHDGDAIGVTRVASTLGGPDRSRVAIDLNRRNP